MTPPGVPLWQLGACDLASGIHEGSFTAVEALRAVVDRIHACNPALNAIVYPCFEAALDRARVADEALARGESWGPLHGVPVTVKENVDVAGMPTPNGVAAFEQVVAPDDSPVTRNLLAAGAILIGRTTTPEFSMRASTDSPLHGRTCNPWDPGASAGGSSGGAGAAAAAGMGPLHHGNDIGGSLRFPAFACGVCTVKPTVGRVPAFNPSAAAERGLLSQLISAQGAICREVRDLRLATRVLSRGDARDPWWVPVPFEGEPLTAPIRVAFTKNAHGYPLHPGIAAAIDRAARVLSDAGYEVEPVEPPPMTEAAAGWMSMALAELRATVDPMARRHGSPEIRQVFDWYYEMGDVAEGPAYLSGIAARTRLTRAWNVFLDRYPLVLSPFLMRPIWPWDYDTGAFGQLKDVFDAAIYSYGVNYLALPAGVVPAGWVDAMPVGVQIIGRRDREDLILDAMATVERAVGVPARELWAREAAAGADGVAGGTTGSPA
jgi:amidase